MKNAFILFLFTLLVCSCEEPNLLIDVSNNEAQLEFKHYEQDLFNINKDNFEQSLDSLAQKYPVFISGDYKEPAKLIGLHNYLNNDLNIQLYNDWSNQFKNYDTLKNELNRAFSHYKHYYPNDSLPTIYTYISGLNYEEPIVVNDNNILIGIDMFYGKDYKPYAQLQIPQYISKNNDKKYIPPVIIREFAKRKFAGKLNGSNMLETMVALGKIEYFIEAMMPEMMDSIRFQFTPSQMVWCYSKEGAFWQHLTMKQLLFSKDYHTYKKFLQHGPFVSSKERESPGRAGIFIGYQIVKGYMENNPEVTLQELMNNTDFTAIFKASKYNP